MKREVRVFAVDTIEDYQELAATGWKRLRHQAVEYFTRDLPEETPKLRFPDLSAPAEAPRNDVWAIESDDISIFWKNTHTGLMQSTKVIGLSRLTLTKLE